MIIAYGFILLIYVLVYFIGCIVFLFLSPKIVKGFFSGASFVGTMVGGALTSVAAGIAAGAGVAAVTGALGNGALANAARSLGLGPAGGNAPGPDPAAGFNPNAAPQAAGQGGVAASAAAAKGLSPQEETARLATAVLRTGAAREPGPVSAAIDGNGSTPPPNESQIPSNNVPGEEAGTPGFDRAASVSAGTPSAPPIQRSSRQAGTRATGKRFTLPEMPENYRRTAKQVLRGGFEVLRHMSMAAGSGGSLSNYVQTHMGRQSWQPGFPERRPPHMEERNRDEDVPKVI